MSKTTASAESAVEQATAETSATSSGSSTGSLIVSSATMNTESFSKYFDEIGRAHV